MSKKIGLAIYIYIVVLFLMGYGASTGAVSFNLMSEMIIITIYLGALACFSGVYIAIKKYRIKPTKIAILIAIILSVMAIILVVFPCTIGRIGASPQWCWMSIFF